MKIKSILLFVAFSLLLLQWGTSPEDSVQVTRTHNWKFYGYNAAVSSPSGRTFIFYVNSPNIWAQALSPNGVTLWPGDGKPIYQNGRFNGCPVATADGEGGAIVIWKTYPRSIGYSSLRAQRIDQDGNLLWGPDGVFVSDLRTVTGVTWEECFYSLVSDGSGGAYIAYDVNKRGFSPYSYSDTRVYIQRLNSNGERVFGDSGLPVAQSDRAQFIFSWQGMVADGEKGVIISWIDNRYGNPAVLAQRFNKNGEKLWSEPGVIVCRPQSGKRVFQTLVSDYKGGAIIAWKDKRPELTDYAIYARRIDKDGNLLWKEEGRFVGIASFRIYGVWSIYSRFFRTVPYHMIADGYSGALFSWCGQEGILIQRINENGDRQWDMDGIQITPHITYFLQWPLMAGFGSGKYLVTWYDASRVYVQIFDEYGNLYLEGSDRIISRGLGEYLSFVHRMVSPVYDGTGVVVFFPVFVNNRDWNIYAQRVLQDGKLGYSVPDREHVDYNQSDREKTGINVKKQSNID